MTGRPMILDDIDEVAVELACRGERAGQLNAGERRQTVRILTCRGYCARQIAEHIGCSDRTVVRDRSALGIAQYVPHHHDHRSERQAA